MQENTLFWGLLVASPANALCVCSHLGGLWSLAAG